MSLETLRAQYPVFTSGRFENLTLRDVVALRKEQEPRPFIWSARLSTGIFGLPGCSSGNSPHVPKGENEVMLAFNDTGLHELIELGFVPCPSCHPEQAPDFWQKTRSIIEYTYPFLPEAEQILDRNLVPFDARRLKWEIIAPYITKPPNRLYIPPNLPKHELFNMKVRFHRMGFELPAVGFYDSSSPDRFTQYSVE